MTNYEYWYIDIRQYDLRILLSAMDKRGWEFVTMANVPQHPFYRCVFRRERQEGVAEMTQTETLELVNEIFGTGVIRVE